MTEVNRSNFGELIPEIIEKLKDCAFIAIDAEYTGLLANSTDPKCHNSLFDSAEERYEKLRKGFASFQISQFGLAIFRRCWERNEYFVDAYNIYLYPVAFDDFHERDLMYCQISSLNFLAANNFDFNKFLKEGVPYLRKDDRKQLRQYLRKNPMFMRWMEVRDRNYFPKYIEKLKDDDEEDIVQHLNGFTKVIHAISELNQPIIGHNMLMDLILIYKQFYEDLPPSYQEFKDRIHDLFPNIYDSKHISAALRLNLQTRAIKKTQDVEYLFDTSLFALYVNTAKVKDLFSPFITPRNEALIRYRAELEAGLGKNLESLKDNHCHEAGLDAIITGAVFLRLCHISERRDMQFLEHRTFAPTIAETFSAVSSWKNCVNIVRAQTRFINLAGEDPPVDKPNWIRVKGNPGTGKSLDIEWIRTHLPKFGDVEIIDERGNGVLLACSAWGVARNVWKCLEDEGYHLSAQEFPSSASRNLTLTAALALGAGVFIFALICMRRVVWR